MTDEEILELASSYLRELYSGDVGDVVWQPLQEDALLNFARELYNASYNKGFKVGHDAGWELNEEVSRRGL